MKNQEISEIFFRMADILEFKGEVPFKVNAYRNAARLLADLTSDIEDIWKQGKLGELPGIGKALQGKIEDYLLNNKISQYEELLKQIPKDLFLLLSIQNFGPKTAALAYKKLGVETLDDLEKAIRNGKLAELPGMGDKKIAKISKGLELLKTSQERISIGIALPVIDGIKSYLKENAGSILKRLSHAGSTRRGRETVHDIDILAESDNGPELVQIFVKMPNVTQVLGAGDTKASIILNDRIQVDLRVVKKESYGAALQYFTGSQAHNIRLRGIAKNHGLKINEYGIYDGDRKIGGEEEEDIYKLLGMDWISPELREDRGEIEAALARTLPDLVTIDDIKSDLHIHSTYSDGQLGIKEMSEIVRTFGYTFMAICDHSKSAFYANGLNEDRLYQQIEEINELNRQNKGFHILAGCEVDILPNGDLDFSDNILKKLDFVISSIHSAFETEPTKRTLAAIHNPYVDVIGHPTGRLISRRDGFAVDMNEIIKHAAETGTALEVNSYWDRLDLSDINIKKAIDNGVKLSINTDTHHPNHLPMMELGVATARRGWARKQDIINTMTLDSFRAWQKRNTI
ncbi:DNA polymerase/3'-5' exonuclease PolX [candidate division KSB1 bacterium]|nr:DNA polymerase/3'-5' exonuclease PolX [candidate division KSB1 bacterium]